MTLVSSIPNYKGWSLDIHSTNPDDTNQADAQFWIEVRHAKLRHIVLRSQKHNNDIGPVCVLEAMHEIIQAGGQQLPRFYRDSFVDFTAGFITQLMIEATKG